ncbi:MAG: hypothetical protein WA172_20090 [Terriglobales bacterium]
MSACLAVLNYHLVADLYLTSVTTQFYAMLTDIESMRKMDIFTSGDPKSHWYDRFGSFQPSVACAKSSHVFEPPTNGLRHLVTKVGYCQNTASLSQSTAKADWAKAREALWAAICFNMSVAD